MVSGSSSVKVRSLSTTGYQVPEVGPSATRSKGFLLRLDVATEPTNHGTHEGKRTAAPSGELRVRT
jgi:hypothetical protein